jgi:hypothetical protein
MTPIDAAKQAIADEKNGIHYANPALLAIIAELLNLVEKLLEK